MMISPQATSPKFSQSSHSYLYLVAPPDDQGAAGEAALAIKLGAQAAIILYRSDTWGTPYATDLNASFYTMGGKSVDMISYTPIASGTYDFSAQLTQADNAYHTLVSTYGASHVVIFNPGFDEDATLYEQASTSYHDMLNSTWINTDSTPGFLQTVGSVAAQHRVFADIFAPTYSAKYQNFTQRMQAQIGTIPTAYAGTSYDAAWLAVLSILSAGKYEGAAVNAVLPSVANNYFGVSGWTSMNSLGDRVNTDYAYWNVQMVSGNATWVPVGLYSGGTVNLNLTT